MVFSLDDKLNDYVHQINPAFFASKYRAFIFTLANFIT